MLKIGEKTFMNLQEAVAWLLENNSIPFQCTANYAANTEIGLGTIVNPTPAKVKIGSLIFFADSKVSTVIGVTENGFICSNSYNNLVDDIAYVTNVAINGSGHLITTLSDGQTIDAGFIKQVSGFSINASQHLIATYNDGSTTDLGAIFSGNITISGDLSVAGDLTVADDLTVTDDLTVLGDISGNAITGDSIIENMSGYSFGDAQAIVTPVYAGACKNGNKITFAIFAKVTPTTNLTVSNSVTLGIMTIPGGVGSKLISYTQGSITNAIDCKTVSAYVDSASKISTECYARKTSNTQIIFYLRPSVDETMLAATEYLIRYEATFLLSENLAQ